jgi:hypothetical protein
MGFLAKHKGFLSVCCTIIILLVVALCTYCIYSKYYAGDSGDSDNSGTVTKEVTDQTTNGVPMSDVDPNTVHIVNQLSTTACTKGKTYDSLDNSNMYASDGCSGIFTYLGEVGYCGGYINGQTDVQVKCPVGKVIDDQNGNVKGLIKPELSIVKDISGGKCVPGNYGLENYNSMYVNNGCNGAFRLGPLIGYCGSKSSQTKNVCPIGLTVTGPDGNPVGLWYQHYRFTPSTSPDRSTCQYISPQPNTQNTYGLVDDTHFYAKNNCSGTFDWSNDMSTTCSSTAGSETVCTI